MITNDELKKLTVPPIALPKETKSREKQVNVRRVGGAR